MARATHVWTSTTAARRISTEREDPEALSNAITVVEAKPLAVVQLLRTTLRTLYCESKDGVFMRFQFFAQWFLFERNVWLMSHEWDCFFLHDRQDGDGTSLSTSTCTIPLWWTNETVWEKADDARCQVNGPCFLYLKPETILLLPFIPRKIFLRCWQDFYFCLFWDERCVFCQLLTFLENQGLESPNFPGRYNNSEKCVAVMPAFSAVTVTAFSTEQYFDVLFINQQSYSGTSRDIENKTFVIRPNSTNISWFPDSSGSRSGWQLCLDAPPACSDGFPVVPVAGEDCPSSIENLSSCETAAPGTLCIGDGTCHTRMDIDNCGQADVYRKMRSKSNVTTFPFDPIPVLVGSAPRPSRDDAGGGGGGYGYGDNLAPYSVEISSSSILESRRRFSRRRWTSAVIWNKIGENTCQVNDHCLESPHFPHDYPSESGCFAKLQEPFRLFEVTAFSTDPGDKLWIDGKPYSGTDAHSITNPLNQSFLLESAIMWPSQDAGKFFLWVLSRMFELLRVGKILSLPETFWTPFA